MDFNASSRSPHQNWYVLFFFSFKEFFYPRIPKLHSKLAKWSKFSSWTSLDNLYCLSGFTWCLLLLLRHVCKNLMDDIIRIKFSDLCGITKHPTDVFRKKRRKDKLYNRLTIYLAGSSQRLASIRILEINGSNLLYASLGQFQTSRRPHLQVHGPWGKNHLRVPWFLEYYAGCA